MGTTMLPKPYIGGNVAECDSAVICKGVQIGEAVGYLRELLLAGLSVGLNAINGQLDRLTIWSFARPACILTIQSEEYEGATIVCTRSRNAIFRSFVAVVVVGVVVFDA